MSLLVILKLHLLFLLTNNNNINMFYYTTNETDLNGKKFPKGLLKKYLYSDNLLHK